MSDVDRRDLKVTRGEIVEEARTWIGTKWVHQACLKNVAADCIGLIRGVYEHITGQAVEVVIDYPATWHLFKAEERLYNEVKKHLEEIPIEEARPGDVLLFGFGKGPAHHAGIQATANTFIHSWADVGKVSETRLDEFWTNNIRAVFRYPGAVD